MTNQAEWDLQLLTERLAELEMALFNDGWARLGQQTEREFSRDGLGQIAYLARLMYLKNPLIQRGVQIQAFYVFGQGVTISHEDEDVNKVIQSFLDDASNSEELTSNAAMLDKEHQLQLDGNLFFALFGNRVSGRVRVRTIPFDEIQEIVTNPEDAREVWYYKRVWNQAKLDLASGTSTTTNETTWYPDWRYRPSSKPANIGGAPVKWDVPVKHVKVGGLGDMRFGVAEVYAQIDWAKAYKEFLEDWATLTRAYSRFAHKLSVPGGARGVAAAKAKLGTTYASGGNEAETNPPPVVGSTFVAGQGVDLSAIKIGGANVSAEDGRRLLLMVAAGAGLPETFYGDVSVGTLATANSLDRPTELKMKTRQTLWADIFQNLISYVLETAIKAGKLDGQMFSEEDGTPKIELAGDIDAEPTITFPPILEHDVNARVDAIVSAATLDGKTPAGTMDDETLIRLLLAALGIQDPDKVMDALQKEEEEQAAAAADSPDTTPAPAPDAQPTPDGEDQPEPAPTAESMMIAAVQELRQALHKIVESAT
jgi:hypothetical protein